MCRAKSEINFKPAPLSIVREALHPAVINLSVTDQQRAHDVITIDDPMPTLPAPVGFRCVAVDAVDAFMLVRVN